MVFGVVGGEEKPENSTRVPRGSGDEVSNGGRGGVGWDLGGGGAGGTVRK